MSNRLSRRAFLKAIAALSASGALAWKSDKIDTAPDEPSISDEEWLAAPPPFTPYYLEKPYAEFYGNLMTLSHLSGLEAGEVSIRVYRHQWRCEAILDYYKENGDFPDDF